MVDYDPLRLAAALERSAKSWWGTTLLLKVAGFSFGAVAIFSDWRSQSIPYWVFGILLERMIYNYAIMFGRRDRLYVSRE